ncbi:MAG: PIN domain nuclease [Deltaproteobacteria bacterium]|nr:MAG: PIN domain nuclease [Deltaproteobacteria bacterium]
MIVVLDASAGVEIVLRRKRADALEKHLLDADWVVSPTLYVSEISNVFWKYHRFNNLPIKECEKGLEHALSLPDELCSDRELCVEAFSLSCLSREPVYDMLYLVAARRRNGYLLTVDRTLKETAISQSIRVL